MTGTTLSYIRSRVIVRLRRFLLWLYSARLRRYPELRALWRGQLGSRSAHIDLAEAMALYEHVLARKPKKVLDLGAGLSSAILALALRRLREEDPNFLPTCVALEENPQWLAYHQATIPSDLLSLIDLRLSGVATETFRGERAAYFQDIAGGVGNGAH